ncbi:hypothetical protein QA646_26400 (plasmid) [Rhizobium sp. CB3090]|uniref:hypothetical protein n=1 Tax=Rhizobium sp. CB3090 TaxID=3039156 RepID=UPI0024B23968|nr:hypothetical protein [Rhizobium sp. CB3090]WFU11912.1 hypothetical protein QA646_26400 [Rhizobium sp. CB3090]
MSDENDAPQTSLEQGRGKGPKRQPATHLAAFGIAAVAALAIGAAGGAAAMKFIRPSIELAPLTPVSISSLKDDVSVVTVKGKVAEIYGNKFIVQDDSGRALIETGPAGDNGKLVSIGEPVSVQGRFDQGFLRARYIIHQDGKTDVLRPPPGPPPHRRPLEDALRRMKL